MTREPWLRVKTITSAALEQPETARDTFVLSACAGDDQLEQEVRSLVASAVSAPPLFERPVFATAAVATAIDDATTGAGPQPGERIGSNRILKDWPRRHGNGIPRRTGGPRVPPACRRKDRA